MNPTRNDLLQSTHQFRGSVPGTPYSIFGVRYGVPGIYMVGN